MLYGKGILPRRRRDKWGSGHFGASRSGGKRKHKGIDFAAEPGTAIYSPVHGRVTKLGYPYGDDLSFRYVEVTAGGLRHRLFYIYPRVAKGDIVDPGDLLGIVQDSDKRYPGITNHVHYEILDADNEAIDPDAIA